MIEESMKYNRIGEKIRRALFPQLADVRIVWLESDKEKKKERKTVFAECIKVQEKYEWCCPYDFMIVVYEPNVALFSEKQIEILLEHELKHVGVSDDGIEASYYVVPHDIEEFREIIDKYGIDWAEVM